MGGFPNSIETAKKLFLLQKEFLGENKPINQVIPLVSVCVATYNHSKYISECLDSILAQKTDFDFEVIVGEDDSKDNTREICIEYAKSHQDRIRLFLRDRNLSQYYVDGKFICRFNGTWCRMSARGEYIAMCEGDDYWIDEHKLQKQVEEMKKYPQVAFSFHPAIKIDIRNHGRKSLICRHFRSTTLILPDAVLRMPPSYCPTASMLFKTIANEDIMRLVDILGGASAIPLACAKSGGILYIDRPMSAYRSFVMGSWTEAHSNYLVEWEKYYIRRINSFEIISKLYDKKYYAQIRYSKAIAFFWLVFYKCIQMKISDANNALISGLKLSPIAFFRYSLCELPSFLFSTLLRKTINIFFR